MIENIYYKSEEYVTNIFTTSLKYLKMFVKFIKLLGIYI